jgi:hypothetical protein
MKLDFDYLAFAIVVLLAVVFVRIMVGLLTGV